EMLHFVAHAHYTPEAIASVRANFPARPHRDSLTARAVIDRAVVHVPDVDNDPEFGLRGVARSVGFKSFLGAPMMLDGEPRGAIAVGRHEARPFSASEIELLRTFADQAAIAVGNAELLTALQARTDDLEIASRHKSQFLANMSHELRTPLNAIIGHTESLIDVGPLSDAEQLDAHEKVPPASRHLLAHINEARDLAQIESGN